MFTKWSDAPIQSSYMAFVFTVPSERLTLNKERLGGYYRLSAYYLAKVSIDVPLCFVLPTITASASFWISGLSLSFIVYLRFLLITYLTTATAYVSYCSICIKHL